MGYRFTGLAALILACAAQAAVADSATDLLKQGIDLYKAGKYKEAVPVLEKAYALDRTPDALFALAQAERQSGDCKRASAHYREVLERVSDFSVAKFVQQNLMLCDKDAPVEQTTPTNEGQTVANTQQPAPVVREVRTVDKLGASLLAGGTLGLGVAGGLFVAARSNRDAADRARTFEDYETLSDRAAFEEKAMFVAAGVGVALIGVAVYRWTLGAPSRSGDVAVVPTATGGTVWVTSSW